jgi:hypothetical protein
MTTAFYLSGGGAKGNSDIGALRLLYDWACEPAPRSAPSTRSSWPEVSTPRVTAMWTFHGHGHDVPNSARPLERIWGSLQTDAIFGLDGVA